MRPTRAWPAARAPRSAAAFLLLSALLSGCSASGGAGNAALQPAGWGLGPVTSPYPIFSFVPASGLPDYCRAPESMLREMHRHIVADGGNCVASPPAPDIDGALRMKIWCVLRKLNDPLTGELRCQDSYVAEVWPEHVESSTNRYELQSFSWARRTCGGASPTTYGEMGGDLELAAVASVTSARLERFLDTCRGKLEVPSAVQSLDPPAGSVAGSPGALPPR